MDGKVQDVTLTVGGGGPNGAAVNITLPFRAASVSVDNLTNQYVFVAGSVQRWVRPGLTGVVLPMFGSNKAQARFETPPGQTAPAQIAGQVARLVFSEIPLPSDAGLVTEPSTVRTYGPMQCAVPAAVVFTQLFLNNDGVSALIVPIHDGWISRVYMTLSAANADPNFGNNLSITKNTPVPPPGPGIAFGAPVNGQAIVVPYGGPVQPGYNPAGNQQFSDTQDMADPGTTGPGSPDVVAGDALRFWNGSLATFAAPGAILSAYIEITDR